MTTAWRQRRFVRVIGIAVTMLAASAMLAALLYRERVALLTYDWRLQWELLLPAFVLLGIGLALAGHVWARIMAGLGSSVARLAHLRYYVLSHLVQRLPGTLWYVASRAYFYQQHGDSMRLVTVASSVESVMLALSGGLTTLLFWSFALRNLSQNYLILLGITVAVSLVASHPATVRWLMHRVGLHDAPDLTFRQVLGWLTEYILIWLLGGVMFFFLANVVTPVPLTELSYVVGCWSLVGTMSVIVFFLPTNFGFTEVGLSVLLSAIMPSSVAVLVAVMSRIMILLFEIILAALFSGAIALRQRVTGMP